MDKSSLVNTNNFLHYNQDTYGFLRCLRQALLVTRMRMVVGDLLWGFPCPAALLLMPRHLGPQTTNCGPFFISSPGTKRLVRFQKSGCYTYRVCVTASLLERRRGLVFLFLFLALTVRADVIAVMGCFVPHLQGQNSPSRRPFSASQR